MQNIIRLIILLNLATILELPSLAQAGLGTEEESTTAKCIGEIVPDGDPLWFKPQEVAEAYPTRENIRLSHWCLKVIEEIRIKVQSRKEWGPQIKDIRCAFLITRKGQLQQPLIFSSGSREAEKFISSVKFENGRYLNPPTYLDRRRLSICLNYPRVELYVDFHDPNKDQIYFQRLEVQK
jgi:hypothetical protein